MEEEILNTPYYETTYLDDENTLHIINLVDNKDINFIKERFTIVSSCYKQ